MSQFNPQKSLSLVMGISVKRFHVSVHARLILAIEITHVTHEESGFATLVYIPDMPIDVRFVVASIVTKITLKNGFSDSF